PDDLITMEMQAKKPGDSLRSEAVPLRLIHQEGHSEQHEAYARLIDDALSGEPHLFARQDGVEASWANVDPVLDDHEPVRMYEPGTWGPPCTLLPDGGWHDVNAD
ncbi:MAG: glucose-6-phosphate dehydrogenase, partial [Actinomycetota bacterium]